MPPTALIASAAGIASALLYSGLLALGMVLGAVPWFLSPAPLVLVGLTLGRDAGFIACAVGLAAIGLVSLSPGATLVYLVSDTLPALIMVSLALRQAPGVDNPDPAQAKHWYPPGGILARLALAPPLIMVALALAAPGHVDGLQGLLREHVEASVDLLLSGAPTGFMDDAERTSLVNGWVMLLPSSVAAFWLIRAVVAGILAQRLARLLGRMLRPSPAYAAMELPAWSGVLFAAVLGFAALTSGDLGYVAWSAAIALSLPFLLLGFKLVHVVARRTPHPVLVLGVFYFVFLSVSHLSFIAMVLAGLVEFSANLRRRAAGRASEEE